MTLTNDEAGLLVGQLRMIGKVRQYFVHRRFYLTQEQWLLGGRGGGGCSSSGGGGGHSIQAWDNGVTDQAINATRSEESHGE